MHLGGHDIHLGGHDIHLGGSGVEFLRLPDKPSYLSAHCFELLPVRNTRRGYGMQSRDNLLCCFEGFFAAT